MPAQYANNSYASSIGIAVNSRLKSMLYFFASTAFGIAFVLIAASFSGVSVTPLLRQLKRPRSGQVTLLSTLERSLRCAVKDSIITI